MSQMSKLDYQLRRVATQALDAGCKEGETLSAVYEEVFRWCGKDPSQTQWAMEQAKAIMQQVMEHRRKQNEERKNSNHGDSPPDDAQWTTQQQPQRIRTGDERDHVEEDEN